MKTSVALLFVCALFLWADVSSADDGQPPCGPNAARDPCGSVCQPTCEVPNPVICPASCELNGCRCLKGFLFDRISNSCVHAHECPK